MSVNSWSWSDQYKQGVEMDDFAPPNTAILVFREPLPGEIVEVSLPPPRWDISLPLASVVAGFVGLLGLLLWRMW